MATRVLDTLAVTAEDGGGGGALPLTFFDVPWIFTGPVERVFFYPYPHPADQFRAALLPRLVSSLSATLRAFYPLLGRVRPCPDSGSYEFFLPAGGGGGDTVELTVAESEDDFEELSGDGPRDVARLYSLVPRLLVVEGSGDGGFALAAVQVTVFPGRRVALGLSPRAAASVRGVSDRMLRAGYGPELAEAVAHQLGAAEPVAIDAAVDA